MLYSYSETLVLGCPKIHLFVKDKFNESRREIYLLIRLSRLVRCVDDDGCHNIDNGFAYSWAYLTYIIKPRQNIINLLLAVPRFV